MDNIFTGIANGDMTLGIPPFKLIGKAKYVFEMINILANTKAEEGDFYWWAVRGDILARDKDRQPLPDRKLRMN